jgi:hypothetical protein
MAFDNEWHFIAMAYDGNNLTTYIDQTKNTKQVTGPLQQSDSPLRLGGTGGTSSLNVTGYIDDIAIYSYGLTPEEVHENTCSLAKYDLFYSPTAGWDCTIDFQDMAVFAEQWHQTGEGLSADFNSDQIVDIDDLGEFLGFWLYEE